MLAGGRASKNRDDQITTAWSWREPPGEETVVQAATSDYHLLLSGREPFMVRHGGRALRMKHQFQFHHVGVVTRGLNGAMAFYEALGYAASEVFRDPAQRADIVLLTRDDSWMVELVSPTAPDSPAMGWADRIDAGPYHTCYEVPDLSEGTDFLAGFKVYPVMDPVPAVAFGGREVTFLWGRRIGLIELLQASG